VFGLTDVNSVSHGSNISGPKEQVAPSLLLWIIRNPCRLAVDIGQLLILGKFL